MPLQERPRRADPGPESLALHTSHWIAGSTPASPIRERPRVGSSRLLSQGYIGQKKEPRRSANLPRAPHVAADLGAYVGSYQHDIDRNIDLQSTDKDVLERVVKYTGIGSVGGPYKTRSPHHSPMFGWKIQSFPAIQVMKAILPYMSNRRRGRIEEVLQN